MTFTTPEHKYVQVDEHGIPMITGTTMKVVELVTAQKAYGWSPEEIHFQHPYLSMSQIHSALAYYWDHQAEIDADIEKRLEAVKQLRLSAEPFPLVDKLRAQLCSSDDGFNWRLHSRLGMNKLAQPIVNKPRYGNQCSKELPLLPQSQDPFQ